MRSNQEKAQLSRKLTLGLLVVLAVIYAVKTLYLWQKPLDIRITLFVLQLLPFALVLPGVLKHSWRAFAWLCFILQLYFMQAVMTVFSPARSALDWFTLTVVVSVFVIAMMHVRWKRHAEAGL